MRTEIIKVYSAGRQLGAEEETASENNRVAAGKTPSVAEGKGKLGSATTHPQRPTRRSGCSLMNKRASIWLSRITADITCTWVKTQNFMARCMQSLRTKSRLAM